MSVQEAAERALVHPETIRNYIRRGVLKAQKFGRFYVIEERDLKRLLANPPKPGRPSRKRSSK